MEIHQNTWKYIRIHKLDRKYMNTHRKYTEIHKTTWTYMKIHEIYRNT